MAKQTICDVPSRGTICGELVETPLTIQRNGKTYELEVCDRHQKPVEALIESVDAKQVPKASSNGRRKKKATDREIRAWALDNGVDVSPLGRVPGAVREQYQAAR